MPTSTTFPGTKYAFPSQVAASTELQTAACCRYSRMRSPAGPRISPPTELRFGANSAFSDWQVCRVVATFSSPCGTEFELQSRRSQLSETGRHQLPGQNNSQMFSAAIGCPPSAAAQLFGLLVAALGEDCGPAHPCVN